MLFKALSTLLFYWEILVCLLFGSSLADFFFKRINTDGLSYF